MVEKLETINGSDLIDARLPKKKFCVEGLIPQGLIVLGGAPKIGKSWMMMDLCLSVAKGENFWGFETNKSTVLYLCLEDNLSRVQTRILQLTDDAPENVYFATSAGTIDEGLLEQIEKFVSIEKSTSLVVVDTFQTIRKKDTDGSYKSDYEEMRLIKELADKLSITILLVHHLRKQGDCDPLNMISGTSAIIGASDATFVLKKSKRSSDNATLYCTGRDIISRELELRFSSENCVWELLGDSVDQPILSLPREMESFVLFMEQRQSYCGGNTELTEEFNSFSGFNLVAKSLKQMMNKHRDKLEELGVYFKSSKQNNQRITEIWYVKNTQVRNK